MSRFLAALATAAAITVLIAGSAGFPQDPPSAPADGGAQVAGAAAPLDPTEVIAKISVQLDIGAGDDLQEPIALDLGLGYRLWLYPIGHKEGEPPPPGAIPEETTAKDKIAAGESALFTFTANGDAGQDQFRTSRQLLAGTKVGDIARIGFSSAGTTNWVLAGYDIMINDKPFASGKPNVKAGDRDTWNKRLAELAGEIGPLEQVQSDMQQLLLANQLEENDKAQLQDVLAKLGPLVREKSWLEGQLAGKYPWFVDTTYKAPADGKPVVGRALVTLLTFTDKSADTANYVYARIGGRKYFISSPDQPLTGQAGPQIFALDLLAGPLTEPDLRDWALGMLAEAQPYDSAPDRWHGQRVQFEIDGQVRYNSEDSPADRLSLSAVRLIPPAHLDKGGNLVTEEETDRLVYLWDPTKATPLPPPAPDGPDAPPPENPDPPAPDGPAAPPPDNPDPAQPDVAPPTPDLQEPPPPGVPDDQAPPDGTTADGQPSPFGPPDPSQSGFGPPIILLDPFPMPGAGGTPPVGGFDMNTFMNMVNSVISSLLSTPLPAPGGPPAVSQVRITSGLKVDDPFTVQWNMTGDLSQVTSYTVNLVEIQPDQVQPVIFGNTFAMPDSPVSAGGPLISSGLPAGLAAQLPRFLQAQVTANTTAGAGSPPSNPEVSAARMVFPANTNLGGQPVNRPKFKVLSASPPTPPFIAITGPEPPAPGGGVWKFGDQPSGEFPSSGPQLNEFLHQSIRFAAPTQGLHLFMRDMNPGDKLSVRLNCPNTGAVRNLVADLGFRGTGATATGTVTANITGLDWFADASESSFPTPLGSISPLPLPTTTDASNGVSSMILVTADPTGLITPPDHLAITIEFSFNGTSPTDPPVLFGVRMIP